MNCLCDVCGKPSLVTGARCTGNRKRVWVRLDDQPDPTGDPALWRGRYQGKTLPIHVYGDTPIPGEYYLARLLCSSSQYVVYIPQAPGGLFYVIYDSQDVYRLLELVANGGVSELKTAWAGVGVSGVYIAPASRSQDPKKPDQDVVNVVTYTDVYYSEDSAATWGMTLDTTLTLGALKFDMTTKGLGWTVGRGTFDAAYDAAVIAGMDVPVGLTSAANGWLYTDWYANGAPLTLYHTADGGKSFNAISLGYLGQVVPARLQRKFIRMIDWIDNVNCPSNVGVFCGFQGTLTDEIIQALTGCDPSGSAFTYNATQPIISGRKYDRMAGDALLHYYLCDQTTLKSSAYLTVWRPTLQIPHVAPLHNGSEVYVAIGGSYSKDYGTDPVAGPNHPVMPLSTHAPDGSLYVSIFYRVSADGSYTYWMRTSTTSFDFVHWIEADPSNPDTFYALTEIARVLRLSWAAQTGIDISPSLNIQYVGSMAVLSTGTILVPCIDIIGGSEKFGIYRSADRGNSWTFTDLSSYTNTVWDESCMIARSSRDVAAMMLSSGKVAFSTDDGETWQITAILGKDFALGWDWVSDIGAG